MTDTLNGLELLAVIVGAWIFALLVWHLIDERL